MAYLQIFCNELSNVCVVISVLKNETIIPLNLAEYGLILAKSIHGLVG